MGYDERAADYARHRAHDPDLLQALLAGSGSAGPSHVLEIGCGTGNYISALEQVTGASCAGVDPSAGMLEVAERRSRAVRFARGAAESLPFGDGEFDFVFSVSVVHHLLDVAAYFSEAFRVLRAGGAVCTVTEDEAMIRGRLQTRYFPETVDVELARYPEPATLRAAMAAAGFAGISEERLEGPHRIEDSGPYRDGAHSSLLPIPRRALARGLERLERDLRAGPVEGIQRALLLWGKRR